VRKRIALAVGALVLLGIGAVAAYVLYVRQEGADVRGSSTVEFVAPKPKPTPTPAPAPPLPLPTPRPQAKPKPRPNPIVWPAFGFDPARHHVASNITLRPPYRRVWTAGGNSLLEFPPTLGYGRLYLASAAGNILAISTRTGRRAWVYRAHRCLATSPALGPFGHGTIYATFLNRKPCERQDRGDGEVVALSVGRGKLRWRRLIGASETPPVVVGGVVYVGDWTGRVYALDASTGRTRWTFEAGGEVKGGIALAGGRAYLGSYDGHVYALDVDTGKLVWRASADPRPFAEATFYSTPAVAYGRVYIGGTDGKVYSFGATTGKRRWSQSTGGYVYGSPAIWNLRVYVGSYSGTFYAFDAATGEIVWRFRANGPISGSATVIAGVVYFATLRGRTYALDAENGHLLWSFPDGKYASPIADSDRIYALGYGTLYALVERTLRRPARNRARPAR
jgi:outer membrane protein assembly factor BamB